MRRVWHCVNENLPRISRCIGGFTVLAAAALWERSLDEMAQQVLALASTGYLARLESGRAGGTSEVALTRS